MIPNELRPMVYVVSRLPVGSQTFVEREWKAVAALHRDLYVFGLEPFGGKLMRFDTATNELVAQGDVRSGQDLFRALTSSVSAVVRLAARPKLVWNFSTLFCTDTGSFLRLPYVFLQMIILAARLLSRNIDSPHLHAHFLGRTFEVACGVRLIIRKATVSGTGHAGDVHAPMSEKRLKALVNSADQVIGASNDICSRLAELLHLDRPLAVTVRCGVSDRDTSLERNFELPESIRRRSESRPHVLSVGRVVPKKGFDDCVAASELLSKGGFNHCWAIVGDGPMRSALEECAGPEADRQIMFAGGMPNEHVMYLLKSWADVFVLPAKQAAGGDTDGIPVVLMEAMRSGVPVVTTHVGGIRELVKHDATGIITPVRDPNMLAAAIEALWSDREKMGRISDSARIYAEENFDADTEARRLHGLLFGINPSPEALPQ